MNPENLVRDNLGYAVTLAKGYPWLDFEDARSEAFLGLVIAAHRHCERGDTRPFLPLAKAVIQNRLSNLTKRERKHSRRRADMVDCAYEAEFKFEGSARRLKRILRKRLTAEEWRVVKWLRKGFSQSEIAELEGVSRRTVIRRVALIRLSVRSVLRDFS